MREIFALAEKNKINCIFFEYFINQFENERKPGWDELTYATFLSKIESDIEVKYLQFERENEKKERFFDVSLKSIRFICVEKFYSNADCFV